MREAIEAQLDPAMGPRERARRLAKVLRRIEHWQASNARAARSHHRQRLRQLHERDILLSTLEKCFHVF